MLSGYGSGKTHSLVMKMLKLMDINRGKAGGLISPSYKMLRRDIVPLMYELLQKYSIPYRYNKSEFTWYFPELGTKIYCFTAEDEGRSIKGPNLAWIAYNELTLCSKAAYLVGLSRVRIKCPLPQVIGSGTPEGFSWYYDEFLASTKPDTKIIFGSTRDNKFLSEHYVKSLEENYDELMQKMYLDGIPVNLNEQACIYAFNRQKYCSEAASYHPNYPVWISIDFNVTPMAATLWSRTFTGHTSERLKANPYELVAFDEIRLTNSNTFELAVVIKDRLKAFNIPLSHVTLYPDPAGSSRSTKSINLSDIDILKQAGFKDIKYRTIQVRDALNATNNMFAKGRILINSKKCPNLIADLEQCVYRSGTFDIDKSDINRSHWLDGLKNMVLCEFSITRPKPLREVHFR